MDFSELIKQIKEGKIITGVEKEKIINDITRNYNIFDSNIHYLWGKLHNIEHLKIRIKADDGFYKIIKKHIKIEGELYFLIDKECFNGEAEHQLIYTKGSEILDLLEENYWELDEVYIFDKNYDWIISINHIFEILFVGKRLSNFVGRINSIIEAKKYII